MSKFNWNDESEVEPSKQAPCPQAPHSLIGTDELLTSAEEQGHRVVEI